MVGDHASVFGKVTLPATHVVLHDGKYQWWVHLVRDGRPVPGCCLDGWARSLTQAKGEVSRAAEALLRRRGGGR